MSEPTFDQRTDPTQTPAPDGTPAPAPEPVAPVTPEPVAPDFNYYVWLADGTVLRVMEAPAGTRYAENGIDMQIVGVYSR